MINALACMENLWKKGEVWLMVFFRQMISSFVFTGKQYILLVTICTRNENRQNNILISVLHHGVTFWQSMFSLFSLVDGCSLRPNRTQVLYYKKFIGQVFCGLKWIILWPKYI